MSIALTPDQIELLRKLCDSDPRTLLRELVKQSMLILNNPPTPPTVAITNLTDDVVASGPGSAAASINQITGFAGINVDAPGGVLQSIDITGADNATALTVAGGSVTGSGTTPFASITGTWNTSGAAVGAKIAITETAADQLSRLFSVLGGSAGTSERFAVRSGSDSGVVIGSDHGTATLIVNSNDLFTISGTAGLLLNSYQQIRFGFTGFDDPIFQASSALMTINQPFRTLSPTSGTDYLQISHDGTNANLTWNAGTLVMSALPTSSSGLASGALYTTAGAVMQVP